MAGAGGAARLLNIPAITLHSKLRRLSDDNIKAEVGYELLPGFQGQAIMQEAVSKVIDFGRQHIGLHSIEAYTHAENHSSTKLLEKFNFKMNGPGEGNLIMFRLSFKD